MTPAERCRLEIEHVAAEYAKASGSVDDKHSAKFGCALALNDWQGELIRIEDEMRTFETGATRDSDEHKIDPEGFMSPLVESRFSEYMHKNRVQADGGLRDSDNWQKSIPLASYAKSAHRHFLDFWLEHRGFAGRDDLETALCGLYFNVQGYLHETLKARGYKAKEDGPSTSDVQYSDHVNYVVPQNELQRVAEQLAQSLDNAPQPETALDKIRRMLQRRSA